MKKIIVLAGFLLIPLLSSASLDTNIKYGDRGVAVIELQEFLIDNGYLKGEATGNFFALTKKAVASYQTAQNLPATGFVGSLTRAKINTEIGSTTTAEIQETGTVSASVNDASTMQKQLEDLKVLLADLVKKQDESKVKADETNIKLGAIQTNTTPVQPTPAPVVVEVDKSDLVITVYNAKPAIGWPYRGFDFQVTVLDKNGKPVTSAPVSISAPENALTGSNNIKSTNTSGSATLSYLPLAVGTKTVIFTSGNLTKTKNVLVEENPIITNYTNQYNTTVNQINALVAKYNSALADLTLEVEGRGITQAGFATMLNSKQAEITKQIVELQKLQEKIITEFTLEVK